MPETTEIAFVLPAGGEIPSDDRALVRQRHGDRILIVTVPADRAGDLFGDTAAELIRATERDDVPDEIWDALAGSERLALEGHWLCRSEEYQRRMEERPGQGLPWDHPDFLPPDPPDGSFLEAGVATWNKRLRGSVSIGLVIVSGPGGLAFSGLEKSIVMAQVQTGLSWLGTQFQLAAVTFVVEQHDVSITTPADPGLKGFDALEDLWRNPAMAALGYPKDQPGVEQFAKELKDKNGTDGAYVSFFTHYPLEHFAYTRAAWPETVMQYWNDGWGPLNLGSTFVHETGHIFGAPDEYGNCSCREPRGYYDILNFNCEKCAGGGDPCIMGYNYWTMCRWTPRHIGAPAWQPGTAIGWPLRTPTTPAAADGLIYFRDKDTKLCRVNRDGSTDWLGRIYLASSPILAGDFLYFQNADNRLCRIRTDGTGGEWLGDNYTASAPFLAGKHIYYRGTNDKLYRWHLDEKQGEWLGSNYTSARPFAVGKYVFFRGTNDKLYRWDVDAKSGKWLGDSYTSSGPFVADGVVYFQGTNDQLYRINTDGTDGKPVSPGWRTYSTPYVTGGVIYFQGPGNNLCWMKTDGTNWVRHWSYYIRTSPYVADGVVYAQGSWWDYNTGVLAINLS